jgi:transposase
MPSPLSMDLRERIADAVHGGLSRNAAALKFAVAPSSAVKLMQALKKTGSLEPKQMGGYGKAILEPHEETVRALVEATPDATLAELGEALARKRIKVGRSALSAFLAKLGLSFKKNPARQRAIAARRG